MSGGPDGGRPHPPDALVRDEAGRQPHYPDEPADDLSSARASRTAPDADERAPDDAGEPGGDEAREPAAREQDKPADVTVELTDRPETTVRDVEPGPETSDPEDTDRQPAREAEAVHPDAARSAPDESPWYEPSTVAPDPAIRGESPSYQPPSYQPPSYQPPSYRPASYETQPDPSTGQYGTGGVRIMPVDGGWDGVRRRHRRHTVTFLAGLFAVLAVGFVAWLTYSGVVPWPWGGKVNTAQSICSRSKPLPPQQITLRVYNGSTRRGLAASVSAQLKAYGFNVQETGNDPLEAKLRTPIELRHGDSGKLAGLTVRAYLAGKVHDVRDDRQADTVDVVLGPSFTHVHTRREANRALAALAPTLPLTCPAGVTPSPSVSR